ncbi:Pr6Pr family membrane protein [Spiroplasma endosymbiont of Diplazon laetatorius]|uniref:Pr6Pr family membrane protein n=1 Tax=Spiroplasma endosymbiont of Diplazon laetatorius TaxID=3066322 RepID=UPI0030D5C1BC
MKSLNFQVTYKYFFGLLSFFTIFSYYIWNIVTAREVNGDYQGNYEIYTIDYFTTFTLLSNLLVQIWFIYAAINHKKEGRTKFLSNTTANALATIITVTLIVYNGILIPVEGFPSHPFSIFVTLVDHAVVPVAFILYINLFMTNKEQVGLKEFFIKKFWIQFAMVLSYCLYAMVRGEFRYNSSGDYYYNAKEGINLLYPYFFLDVHHVGPGGIPGYGWFFIAFFAILGMLVGFSFLYNFINNKVINKGFYQKLNK